VSKGETVEAILAEYQATLESMSALGVDSPRAHNRLFRKAHVLAKSLRASAEGRAAIEGIIASPDVTVALNAASEALAWDCQLSLVRLEEIERAAGLDAVSAHYTLKAYREGTLNLDW